MGTALKRWLSRGLGIFGGLLLAASAAGAGKQTTSLQAEYMMSVYVPLEAHVVGNGLTIINHPGGRIEGPRISGKIIPPSGDWLRRADGFARLDVRLTVQADDNEIIYISYNGVFQCEKEVFERFLKGGLLQANDCYFITAAPTFQTKSERYSWLNSVQAVGKMVEIKGGDDAHLTYDIFLMK
jgi:Protein of unknown function (DUF3237)